MTDQPPIVEPSQPCAGFPDKCPNLIDVDPDPAGAHGGGVRCGCDARAELEGMAFTLATGIGGIVDPRTFKATLDRYADQVLQAQPSLRTCLHPGCMRQYDVISCMKGDPPPRPEWSGEGWRTLGSAAVGVGGHICPDHVDTVTAHMGRAVEAPAGRWMVACACGWMSRPQAYGGLLRPLWEEHLLLATGELSAPPVVDETLERIPLDQHTEGTLTELYDALEDTVHDRRETYEAGQAMYRSWDWHRHTLGGVARAVTAVRNHMRVDSRDWAADRSDAYLYAVLIGWDDDALKEVADKHQWNEHRVKYIREMRALLAPITDPQPKED